MAKPCLHFASSTAAYRRRLRGIGSVARQFRHALNPLVVFVLEGQPDDDLVPDERTEAQHQTPEPLAAGERSGGEGDAAELDDDHLNDRREDEDAAEDEIGGDARKDVLLAVYLATVDLIEERHEDKGIEDDGVVLRGWRLFRSADAPVDVEEAVTTEEQQHQNDKLVDGIANDNHTHR